VGLNPPLHTQHNEGVGGCKEGNPNAAIRRLWVDRNEGGISSTYTINTNIRINFQQILYRLIISLNFSTYMLSVQFMFLLSNNVDDLDFLLDFRKFKHCIFAKISTMRSFVFHLHWQLVGCYMVGRSIHYVFYWEKLKSYIE
jgi:hypothetical protein